EIAGWTGSRPARRGSTTRAGRDFPQSSGAVEDTVRPRSYHTSTSHYEALRSMHPRAADSNGVDNSAAAKSGKIRAHRKMRLRNCKREKEDGAARCASAAQGRAGR